MRKLTIDNFGPIKHAEININKYNIFIGPQSAGKSCIMKVLAFCRTVENMLIQGRENEINNPNFINNNLLGYYNLDYYIIQKGNTSILYTGYSFSVRLKIGGKTILQYKKNKESNNFAQIAYVPAERCIVSAIPNLFNLKFPNDNNTCLSKYISEWEYARKKISGNTKINIPGTSLSYYYDSSNNIDKLRINSKTNIELSAASSGIQSLVPISLLIYYYMSQSTKTLRDTNKYEEAQKLLNSLKGTSISEDILEKLRQELNESKREISPCEFFIEEPEVNIFPKTQYELVKWIIKTLNSNKNENSLFMATHSPYILTSINNLIQAGNSVAANPDAKDKIIEMMGTDKFINYDEISVYSIGNGTAKSIKNDELKLIDSNDIDSVSDRISEEFSKLLDYEG